MIDAGSCPANSSVPFPQRMLEVLGRLQAHAASTIFSSIYIYDLVEQRTLYTSHPVIVTLGYIADAAETMSPIWLASLIHPDDLNRVSEHYQRFTTLRYGEVITIEYRMRRADGTWCRLRSQETPLVQAIDGFPLQILGMVQDVTQLSTTKFRRSVLLAKSLRQRRAIQRTGTPLNRRKQRILSKINRPRSAS